jgi:hypothetical protein
MKVWKKNLQQQPIPEQQAGRHAEVMRDEDA